MLLVLGNLPALTTLGLHLMKLVLNVFNHNVALFLGHVRWFRHHLCRILGSLSCVPYLALLILVFFFFVLIAKLFNNFVDYPVSTTAQLTSVLFLFIGFIITLNWAFQRFWFLVKLVNGVNYHFNLFFLRAFCTIRFTVFPATTELLSIVLSILWSLQSGVLSYLAVSSLRLWKWPWLWPRWLFLALVLR